MRVLHNNRRRSQRGAALLELALATPIFIIVIYGLFSVALLMRAQYHIALVSHAIMREAAAGVLGAYELSARARVYGRQIGMADKTQLVVDMEPAHAGNASGLEGIQSKLGLGVKISILGIVPVGGLLRIAWPEGVPMRCSVVCLPDPWKSPFAFLKAFIVIPEML